MRSEGRGGVLACGARHMPCRRAPPVQEGLSCRGGCKTAVQGSRVGLKAAAFWHGLSVAMARELKRTRSASPPREPTDDMEVDDAAGANQPADVDDADGKVSMARLSIDQGWQCRVCGERFDWLRFIPHFPGGTWVCNHCMHRLWEEFETMYQKTWEDWDSEWPNFCAFVVQNVKVRPSWQARKP